ncbi:DNA-directed RNA polymerase subunit omega [Butyrivibrio sp. MC2013]|uniref:DNA-directed RNA polymerase subunit omega n=1 Tax=Butyrivibrio sp. MC2013 TaxID=1280686 RepID=UPI0004295466|nr:DNA-directed RNA polymerase subunit omega [Butyrivibrio sp. MC2013]
MIHPSYVDLMNVVNKGVEEGEEPVISSRYSIVMATAKRARQLIAGDDPMIYADPKDKALSTAVKELYADELHILTDEEKEDMALRIEEMNKADAEAAKSADAARKEAKTSAEEEVPEESAEADAEESTEG